MKKIGIIAAMDSEMRALAEKMENCAVETIAAMPYYSGTIDGVPVIICNCGVGKVNAAMHTQILLDRFSPDILIQTGVAGSLSPEVGYFDFVVGKELVYHDMQTWILEQFDPLQTVYEADDSLVDIAVRAAGKCRVGRIATGDQFISDAESRRDIASRTQALCTEMEGCAVAQTAVLNSVPFVILRAISDMADGTAEESFPVFAQKAADRAVEILLRMLPEIEAL